MVVVLALLPFASTLLGGAAVLRLRHRLHPIMGFAAGVVVTTALADLLPEAWDQVGPGHGELVGGAAICGFLAFSVLEAFLHRQSFEHGHPPSADPHHPHEHELEPHGSGSGIFGWVGTLGLIAHSTLDGLAIGLGFQASASVGVLITMAVVGHDFADGMNVVTLAFTGGLRRRHAMTVLLLDAVAPVIGVAIGGLVPVSHRQLGLLLAVFSGVFIAIGAGHLLPEAQHREPGIRLVALAALGAALVLVIRAFAP